ncbi:CAP domain-containing protein [Labilibacter marinus]|uniref:CAP domain-containing protein n=1 Tax=Labilibacter marinus TaxID=1477105 RepID=UPI00117A77B4|nr:CAP domain-containing protein [Labilibacter marinus]
MKRMKTSNFYILLFTLTFSIAGYAQSRSKSKVAEYTISNSDMEYYLDLNDKEQRLSEYKDDKTAILIKLNQLAHINASRKKHQVQLVKLDILACRVANKIAKQAALNGFMGHFNKQGESPYHRFAFAGGTAHVSENAAALRSDDFLPSSTKDIHSYMQQAHNSFMAERRPNDGHKKNCINIFHNYVGLGYYLHQGEFRYYEEFLDNYIEFGDFPRKVKSNQSFSIPVKPVKGKYFHMALAYYEKSPSKMSAATINRIMEYSDFTNDMVQQILPWDLNTENTKGYTPLPFTFKKKGLYYIQIYLDDKPYISGTVNTKGKVQASGVVIKVE